MDRRGRERAPAYPGLARAGGVDWTLAVANRNFLIHQYDEINRELTWLTLSRDLVEWKCSLDGYFADAEVALRDGSQEQALASAAGHVS